jgi:hypothetical protein
MRLTRHTDVVDYVELLYSPLLPLAQLPQF